MCWIEVLPAIRRFHINLYGRQYCSYREARRHLQSLTGCRYNVLCMGWMGIPLNVCDIPSPSLRHEAGHTQWCIEVDNEEASPPIKHEHGERYSCTAHTLQVQYPSRTGSYSSSSVIRRALSNNISYSHCPPRLRPDTSHSSPKDSSPIPPLPGEV